MISREILAMKRKENIFKFWVEWTGSKKNVHFSEEI